MSDRDPVAATMAGAERHTGGAGGPSSLRFSEEMRGHVALGATDPDEGLQKGLGQGSPLLLHAEVSVPDIDRFIADPMHEAAFTGFLDGVALGGRRAVERGIFNLFPASATARHKQMRYRIYVRDGDGRPLTFSGRKEVVADGGPGHERLREVWPDNTTLYSRLLLGHVGPAEEDGAEIVGAGIIRLTPGDFLRQLLSLRVHGPTPAAGAAALARFGRLFFGQLWDVYKEHAPSPPP